MANIYNNPFKDFNANFMTPDEIVKSWCNPFSNGILLNAFNEKDFRKDSMPIVLEGIRGSGKTTILKYYSYPLQIARAKQEEKRFIDVVLADESIGFYFRCDEPFVNTFKTIFSRIKKTEWTIFF